MFKYPVLSLEVNLFNDISVDGGSIVLNSSCNRLFLTLLNVSVASGTVDLSSVGLTYPLGPTELESNGVGLIKQ